MTEYITDADRFSRAVEAATSRERGLHGSVGTQNEKLIHAALKAYYAEFPDEQEIRIGGFFADAVCEDGIFEIQTRQLYKLKAKLKAFLEYSRVTVVYPSPAVLGTVYINEDTGEIVKEVKPRRISSLVKTFEELYSIREFLANEDLRVILARLRVEKRVYFRGELPDMRNRSARKKVRTERLPLELCGETVLECKADYAQFLPDELPGEFTKKEFAAAVGESAGSLRLEVLRTVGVIEKTGKRGNGFLYKRSI